MSSPSADVVAAAPIPRALLSLAPLDLPNFRHTRYQGDGLSVALPTLAESDQGLLRELYETLSRLLGRMVDPATDDSGKWRGVLAWTETNHLENLIDRVQALGRATEAAGPFNENLAKMLHDVRGGALSALLGRLQLLERLPQTEAQLKTLFALTRDHLKIMRNALTGLDDARRDSDRTPRSHLIQMMLKTWHDSVVGPYPGRPIRMAVDSRYVGALTECCLESVALDRTFYNLAANACRHCAGGQIEMSIFEVARAPTSTLRFVLSNPVSDEDAARLRAGRAGVEGGDGADGSGEGIYLDALFEPAVSSTGSGYGLTVVADFVAGAFGLRGRAEAVRHRYVGVRLEGNIFRAFFHWPAANDQLPPKDDNYHTPGQSLSEGSAGMPRPE